VPFPCRLLLAVLATLLLGGACSAGGGSGGGGGSGAAAQNIPGVVIERTTAHSHVQGHIDYAGKKPPSGGNHNPTPLPCGFYDRQQPDEFAVHSLEHGAVEIAFDPSTDAASVQVLRMLASIDHVIGMPYAGMDAPITLVAWEHRLEVQSATDPRVQQFVDAFRAGSQAPEQGLPCPVAGQQAN
jgi:hypothetical protein